MEATQVQCRKRFNHLDSGTPTYQRNQLLCVSCLPRKAMTAALLTNKPHSKLLPKTLVPTSFYQRCQTPFILMIMELTTRSQSTVLAEPLLNTNSERPPMGCQQKSNCIILQHLRQHEEKELPKPSMQSIKMSKISEPATTFSTSYIGMVNNHLTIPLSYTTIS